MYRPSIHAFFKRKSPSSSSPTKPPSLATRGAERTRLQSSPNVGRREDNVVDITGSPPAAKKAKSQYYGDGNQSASKESSGTSLLQTTSGYFSRKGNSGARPPLGDTTFSNVDGMDHDECYPKVGPSGQVILTTKSPSVKPSISLQSYRLPPSAPPHVSQSGSAFENYSIGGLSAPTDGPVAHARNPRTKEQEQRHEEWQRRMVAPGGILPRRRSLKLDEAAVAEARRVAGEDVEAEADVETSFIEDDEEEQEQEGRRRAEGVGSKLKDKYVAKGGQGINDKAKGKGKKKEEDIGPSGQTYTPLEKQYMEIKAENPDVLLLMEGRDFRRWQNVC